jgi:hypothetical protein
VQDTGGDALDVAGRQPQALVIAQADHPRKLTESITGLLQSTLKQESTNGESMRSVRVEVHPAFCVGAEQAREIALNVVARDAAAVFS